MSISPISSSAYDTALPLNQKANTIQQEFQQLSHSLQSNDLADAQQAFGVLQQLLQGRQSSPASALQNDFADIGRALAAGDLKGAQSAFAQLQGDARAASLSQQTHRGGHHHHPHSEAAATDTSGTDPNGQINLLA